MPLNANVTIKVTQQHIDAGQPHSSVSCPIALAISDNEIALNLRVGVGLTTANLYMWSQTDNSLHHVADAVMPQNAERFVAEFDAGKPVKPFEFNLYFGI